jgi:hypothetical protein
MDAQGKKLSGANASQPFESSCASPSNKMKPCPSLELPCLTTPMLDENKGDRLDCTNGSLQKMLEDACSSWQMDAWALNSHTKGKPLSNLACHLFQLHGLNEHFNINPDCLKKFFEEIEQGYDDGEGVPYHNRVHATSVVHLTHMLLTEGGAGKLLGSEGKLEVLACLLAAAIHDHGHRGVNNAFLVKTDDEWALRYNDQHVNEHYHASSAFLVLLRPECNFFAHRSTDEYRKLRNLVISLVLGTDMAQDKKIITSFTKIVEAGVQMGQETSGDPKVDARAPASAEDKLIALQMVLKCADVGHLSLQWSDHLHWVNLLEEEFFAQGDKEKGLSLEVSFLMDRDKPGVTKTQIGFFDYVALPLYQTLVKAFPLAEPMLLGVQANYKQWSDIEAANMRKAQRHTVA